MPDNVNDKFTIEYRSTIDGSFDIIYVGEDFNEIMLYMSRCYEQDKATGGFGKHQYKITTPDVR